MDPLVADNLRYAYPAWRADETPAQVLDGVSLRLKAGEVLAVLGADGAGKTTLCLALAGHVPHLTGGSFGGQVTAAGLDTLTHRPAELARRVGLVFQEAESQLFNMRVEDELAFGLESLGLPPAEMDARIGWALQAVGLDDSFRGRSPLRLSGGQKQRVALAAILAMRPQLLVLDEPAAELDPQGRHDLFHALRALKEQGLSMVIAEQALEELAPLADRALALDRGRAALEGPAAQVFAAVDRLRALGLAEPEPAPRMEPPLARVSAPALQAAGLCYAYDGQPALNGIDLRIEPGEYVALLGANGSGKTTLAKHFIGLLRPAAGQVRVGEMDAARAPVSTLARQVGYVFQNPDHQIHQPSVRAEVAFGLRQFDLPPDEIARRTEAALRRFGLEACADHPPAVLGFALRRKVAVAGVLALTPPALILDEPTSGLDARAAAAVLDQVDELHRAGHTVILITHDLRRAAARASRWVVLQSGRIAADGPADAVQTASHTLIQAGLLPPE